MSTSRYFDRICAIVLVFTLLLTVLFMNGQTLGITMVVDADSEAHSDNEYFTDNDQLSDWDTGSATYITLEGDTISINGSNAYEYDGNLVISNSGRYVITGTLDDGYISVDANANSKVWILFRNVDISCSDNACLRVDQADKVFLTLGEGTVNTLSGGEELSEEALEDGTYGVIFAHDDLTINGSGSLDIKAGYKHGIKANDDLVITGGTITIDAPADGIHVNDSFRIKDADITVTAGDDGILTENEESFFYMESGSITVSAQGDGIHSNGDMILAGGTITMDTGDDGMHAEGDAKILDGKILINSCYEGIEAVTITVSGGEITIYPADDGLNAGSGGTAGDMFGGGAGAAGAAPGNMATTDGGGTAPENAAAGGMPPEEMESFTGERPEPPEGMEAFSEEGAQTSETMGTFPEGGAQPPQMPSGVAGNYTEGTQEEAQEGTQEERQESEEAWIRISGGTITIINENGNDADGLDSNGSIYISGGEIRVSLTDSGTNSAIDVATENGGVAQISGGTLIACGSSSMAEALDPTSTQCSIMYNISSGMEAGTLLAVKNEEGEEILSWEVPCSFSSAVISSPEMVTDGTYTVIAGDSEEEMTLTEVSASFGDAQSTMFGGNMNRGGMTAREQGAEASDNSGEFGQGEMEASGNFGGSGQGGMEAAPEEVTDPATPSTVFSYDRDIYVLMLLCVLALSGGLVLAKRYRRRRL